MSLIPAVYNTVLSLRKRTWVSGLVVRKYEIVKSPLDGEDYERITATGGGTTDPADDLTNYVARSYTRTAAIPTGALLSITNANINSHLIGGTKVVTGALAVGVRTSALSITGRGSVDFLGTIKGTAGTWRVEIAVDGRVVHDETIAITAGQAQVLIGASIFAISSAFDIISSPNDSVKFKRSFEVHVTAVTTAAGNNSGISYIAKSEA